MKTCTHKLIAFLILGLLTIDVSVACFLWVHQQRQHALAQRMQVQAQQRQKAVQSQVKQLQLEIRAQQREIALMRQPQYARNQLLVAAMKKNDIKQALALLEAGADPNTKFSQETEVTAFIMACGGRYPDERTGRQDTLAELHPRLTLAMLRHGANVKAKDSYGMTALHWAAAKMTNDDIVKQLLTHGADPDTVDENGETPINIAEMFYKWHPDLAPLLRKYRKNP